MIEHIEMTYQTQGRGLHPLDDALAKALHGHWPQDGLIHLFLLHTSASLILQENADPSARGDLETFLDRLVPDGQAWHEHDAEGPDDSSAHMKAAITGPSVTLPVRNGRLVLGSWQGVYLWEHRTAPHTRRILVTVIGETR